LRAAAGDTEYLLRPETLESIFYQFRATGGRRWQERGWRIFLGLVKHARTRTAYSGLVDVRSVPARHDNSMQSFLFAETFKYLYLLFAPPAALPLDEFVLSTEAHTFRRASFAPPPRDAASRASM
jgi:mannosyl-oligosaccharide alpha-1,2-mannosidase